jgi:hypothetical protein
MAMLAMCAIDSAQYAHRSKSTLRNTRIDLTFTRNICVQTLPYVSYLSYHRPVLNRLMLSSEK